MNRKIVNWADITHHKILVMWFIIMACFRLLWRGLTHDLSKYSREEAGYYEPVLYDLLNAEYGSEEYYQLQKVIEPAKRHHFAANRHHVEYWTEQGQSAAMMSPLDQIEMLADWKASTLGHKTGSFRKSIKINAKRYSFDGNRLFALTSAANEIGLFEDYSYIDQCF